MHEKLMSPLPDSEALGGALRDKIYEESAGFRFGVLLVNVGGASGSRFSVP